VSLRTHPQLPSSGMLVTNLTVANTSLCSAYLRQLSMWHWLTDWLSLLWHLTNHRWNYNAHTHTHTHTHTHPLNGPFSGTTQVSPYQKGKTNLDFTVARDSEWQWHQLGIVCKSAPRSRQITTPAPHHSVFYRPDTLPAAHPTASKHWRDKLQCMYR